MCIGRTLFAAAIKLFVMFRKKTKYGEMNIGKNKFEN
jgi:hypothetical protein